MMPLTQLPAATAALAEALTNWHHVTPEPTSRITDQVWRRGEDIVTLSAWGSASTAHVALAYEYAGMELAHLVLSSPEQIVAWLRLLGLVPSVADVAEALVVAS